MGGTDEVAGEYVFVAEETVLLGQGNEFLKVFVERTFKT